jgi:MFS family permease
MLTWQAAPRYNYPAVCGIYFLASLGLGGNIPIDATIALEFLPQNRRFLVSLLSIWQPIGVVVASAIAFGTQERYRCDAGLPSCVVDPANRTPPGSGCCTVESNMGWRYLVLIIGAMTLFVFFLRFVVFKFHESPKFLLSKGREQEAIDVLHKIAKFNRAPPPTLTVQHFAELEQAETGYSDRSAIVDGGHPPGFFPSLKYVTKNSIHSLAHMKGLFTNKLQLFIFILLAITYMGDYWSFNLAGAYLPLLLLSFNVQTGGTVTETYRQYIYIYLPGIIGSILAMFSVQLPLVGRKWSLVFSAAMQGLSMALYTQVRTTRSYVGLNALEYIMQTVSAHSLMSWVVADDQYFNAVLYASAPELFDTAYRGSASGMLSCLGRLAGIVAPFAGQAFYDPTTGLSTGGILWLGAGGIWLSALMMVFLPVEMRNRQMF